MQIQIQDLYFKPEIKFFNLNILDKVFTGISRDPNIYVVKTDSKFERQCRELIFEWKDIRYHLFDTYEHDTTNQEWRIIECHNWMEERVDGQPRFRWSE